jgi:hypothetical protein
MMLLKSSSATSRVISASSLATVRMSSGTHGV